MKFSFILPAYKARFLEESIQSILSQSARNFELIVVDDCSPENLSEIVGRFEDERLHYFKNEKNIGGTNLVAQWNHSIKYATGEYLILASDDDKYAPDYLLKMTALIKKYPLVNVLRPRISYIDERGTVTYTEPMTESEFLPRSRYLELFAEGKILSGIPQYIFKRSALVERGGFVDFPMAWFSDDATIASLTGDGVAIASAPLFYYRWSDICISNMSDNRETMSQKILAAIAYADYMKALALESSDISEKVLDNLLDRARWVTGGVIKVCSFGDFMCGLLLALRCENGLFPLFWAVRMFFSHLKLKLDGHRKH